MEDVIYTIWHGGYQYHVVLTPSDLPSDFQSEHELMDIGRIILADHLEVDIDSIPYPVGMWTIEHGNVYQTATWWDSDDLRYAEGVVTNQKSWIKALVVMNLVLFIALLVMA